VLSGKLAESQSKGLSEDEESGEDYGYLSDSDLEDDEDEKIALPKRTSKLGDYLYDPFGTPSEDRRILCEEHVDRVEKEKIVKIPDMAFVT